jgi:hypothetical protein
MSFGTATEPNSREADTVRKNFAINTTTKHNSMTNPEQQKMTNWIIQQIQQINPYHESRTGNVYAYGFLASYLASILRQDLIQRREFERHIQQLKNPK